VAFSLKKTCKVAICKRRAVHKNGLCKAHYLRLIRNGDLKENQPIGSITGRAPGFSHSAETRTRISNAKVGKNPNRIKRGYRRPNASGINHWNWKGGISSDDYLERRRFYQQVHELVLERDDYTCLLCDKRGGQLHIDHIKGWAKHPELRFELDNCRTLCAPCHYYLTFRKKMPQGSVWGQNLIRRMAS